MTKQEFEVKISMLGFTPTVYPSIGYHKYDPFDNTGVIVYATNKKLFVRSSKITSTSYPTYEDLYEAVKKVI